MEGEDEGEVLEEPRPEIKRHVELMIDKVREVEFPIRRRRIQGKAKCYIQ